MSSHPVTSRQHAPHPRIAAIVDRHFESPYRRSAGTIGRAAFASIAARFAETDGGLILDAGCGTGASTLALARLFPRSFVLGVDKSAARLAAGTRSLDAGAMPANAALLRCDLVDFWQLAAEAGVHCEKQFVLYPNPWPKPAHVMRRWHAHPVLPALLALGGEIELRTNWRVYAEEFAQALRIAGRSAAVEALVTAHPLTPFERKYAASGHALWRCAIAA